MVSYDKKVYKGQDRRRSCGLKKANKLLSTGFLGY